VKSAPPKFVLAYTDIGVPKFLPEMRLRMANNAFELWEAAEGAIGRGELPPPFWSSVWAGGMALARYLLDNSDLVADRCVTDVATGSGVVAIAAAMAGAREVIAYDVDELAVSAASANARLNRVRIETRRSDVRDVEVPRGSLVTAGDVFYDRDIATSMLLGLTRMVTQGAEVLVGDPHRTFLPLDHLDPLASYQVDVDADLESVPVKTTLVARLTAESPVSPSTLIPKRARRLDPRTSGITNGSMDVPPDRSLAQ
jgi:predicted nicotinamide N-methyase